MNTNKMAKMAILSAFSIILVTLIHFPIIPSAPFLEYDPADVPILIGTFMYGPLAGLMITIVVSFIQAVTVSAGSGWVGFVMHVIATGTLVLVAGSIYKKKHTFVGAIIALVAGSLSMTLIMIPANLFFTVKFWGIPYEVVKGMLLPAIIPFNLIKSFANSVITVLIYKSIANILRSYPKITTENTK
ncbi:ECF transporter S component [Anoxybacter fermentans]|uniref:Riboflavin transporter n=1 Tax=Anoxybacter fermentans TaxID=1323375 RepID=A0A3S9SWV1_9FIRM|nr:ECF transporter S component [Anoxybacter fermentans]AZR72720.1 ECF transporter S component [Anoxybacter fermentans]